MQGFFPADSLGFSSIHLSLSIQSQRLQLILHQILRSQSSFWKHLPFNQQMLTFLTHHHLHHHHHHHTPSRGAQPLSTTHSNMNWIYTIVL